VKKVLTLLFLVVSIPFLAQEEMDYEFKNKMYSKSLKELRLIRNEFFAREGYIFKSKDLQEHFSQFDWYNGTKSIDEIELSKEDKLKTEFIRKVENAKKLNKTRIRTLELLAMLPGDSMGSWDWSMEHRASYLSDCSEVGYLINNDSGMMQLRFVDNNHLFMQVVDGVWEFQVIPINGDTYFILTNDIVTGGSSFDAFIVDGDDISRVNKNIFPDGWEEHFKSSKKNCEFAGEAFLDFSLDNDLIIISNWEDQCLGNRELTLKFNKERIEYEIQH